MHALSTRIGHPPGLAVLCLTEIWERFSFYGLKALLVLYLNSGVLSADRFSNVCGNGVVTAIFSQPDTVLGVQALSSHINEIYSGMAYITPLFGGVIADGLLGPRATLLAGGMLMAAGHGCMALERYFLVGLLLLVLGNGLFKPTVSSILSRLYEPPAVATLRDRGFAIFYTGINIGALLAPLVCGGLQHAFGYDAGFGAAGVGMVVGLLLFLGGERALSLEPPTHRCCAPRGAVSGGGCEDPDETGACGFCYGDTVSTRTRGPDDAYFFRMISDTWGYEGADEGWHCSRGRSTNAIPASQDH